jgi:peptidoglycan hydrolase-like amidase
MRVPRGILFVVAVLTLSASAWAAGRVRIAVMGLFHPRQLLVETVPGQSLILAAGGRQLVIGDHSRVSVVRTGGNVRMSADGTEIVADEVRFTGSQGDVEFVLSVPQKLRRVYRGQLSVTSNRKELLAVVEMELETAVASIVAAELPRDTPLEALKAQAVVARSYLVTGGPRHPPADFCDTTHCQFLRNPPPPGSAAVRAAESTKGLVLAWRGKTFPALYSASCGGQTHSLAELGLAERDYPYFSVKCPRCRRELGGETAPSNTFLARTGKGGWAVNGSGRGHGIGLCQLGASSMAQEGKDFRSILAYYFPNTTIDPE